MVTSSIPVSHRQPISWKHFLSSVIPPAPSCRGIVGRDLRYGTFVWRLATRWRPELHDGLFQADPTRVTIASSEQQVTRRAFTSLAKQCGSRYSDGRPPNTKNKPLKSLDAFEKPYYCESNNSSSGAPHEATLPGLAPNRMLRAAVTSAKGARGRRILPR